MATPQSHSTPLIVSQWNSAVEFLVDQHYSNPVRGGLDGTGGDFGFEYDSALNRIEADYLDLDEGESCTVVFTCIESEKERIADVVCDCKFSRNKHLCRHTFAASMELLYELSLPGSAIYRELVRHGSSLPQTVARPARDFLFEALDEFLQADKAGQQTETQQAGLRLAWRIELVERKDGLHVAVQPVEQKRKQRGKGWTTGRKITWSRAQSSEELWTVPGDRRAAAAAKQVVNSYSYYYEAPEWRVDLFEAMHALVGHPAVYWGDDTQQLVSVSLGEAGLGVKASEDGYRLLLSLDGRLHSDYTGVCMVDDEGLFGIDRPGNRVVVCLADERQLSLFQRIANGIAFVPPDKKQQLLDRLPQLERSIPITLPEEMQGEIHPADARLFVRLTEQEHGGVQIALQVRPAAEGAYCMPGEGPSKLTGQVEGARIRVERDLAVEIVRARTVVETLGMNRRALALDSWRWAIPNQDETLDLLADIQKHYGPRESQNGNGADRPEVVVEWTEADHSLLEVLGELTSNDLALNINKKRDWFGIEGTVNVGGHEFRLIDLLNALGTQGRYLNLGDGRWAAISQELRDRLDALNDVLHRHRGNLEFNATALPAMSNLLQDEIPVKATKAWKEALARLDRAFAQTPDPPIAFTAELRDYQLEGYRWLRRLADWGVGGCLADDMGLGKTVQALALLVDRIEHGPALVVAPTSVGFNWMRECERFAPTLKPILYREANREELLKQADQGDLVIASYGLLQRDAEQFAGIEWGTLIFDEAQFIKNSQTKTARAARDLDAKWKLALTGTPIENHLGELWSLFRAVSPGLFGSRERFRKRFADPIEKEKNNTIRHGLARTIRPFVLRRTKSEVLSELPQRSEMQLTAELSKAERQLYEDARLWAVTSLTDTVQSDQQDQRFQVLAALTRLRQLACHPRLVDDAWSGSSSKLNLLLATVEELREEHHRALIFSQFTQHLGLIREALDERGITYQYLDGQTPAKQRAERVDAFQRGESDVFLISLKAGGTGLNLTAADYVIHMDPWWNPSVEDQATDRAHRIGQTRPVMVYRLVARDTIEEQILALHAEKRHLVSGILEGSDQAAKLTTEDLIELIRGEPAETTKA